MHHTTRQLNREMHAARVSGRYFYLHRHVPCSHTFETIRIIRVRNRHGVHSALALNSGRWLEFNDEDHFSAGV